MTDPLQRQLREQEEIRAGLAEGPALRAPLHLYRRVAQGVRIAAWRQREETRFRHVVLGWLVALVAVLGGAVGLVLLTNLQSIMQHGISGGRGWLDYYVTASFMALGRLAAAHALTLMFSLALLTVLMGLLPGRFSRRG